MEPKTFPESVKKERLVLARESRGMLQSELAKITDISQAKISKMESGILEVSEENLEKIAEKLEYPESFFFEFSEVYPLGLHYFRKHKSIPGRQLKAIEAYVNLRRGEIEKLLRSVEFGTDRKIPHCDIEDEKYNNSPEAIANSVRKYWKIPRGPIDNMTDLLESAGILVIPCDFGTREFSGVGTWTREGVSLIFINKTMPGDRMRFTLAHELGHIIMHRLETETSEKEADRFASEFLMPAEDIRHQLFGLTLDKAAQLKLNWKVSMASIIMKGQTLEIDNNYSYLWIQMSKLGYRLNEPIEYSVPQEKPTLFGEMVSTHLNELGFTAKELARMFTIHEDELRSLYNIKRSKQKDSTQKLRLISA